MGSCDWNLRPRHRSDPGGVEVRSGAVYIPAMKRIAILMCVWAVGAVSLHFVPVGSAHKTPAAPVNKTLPYIKSCYPNKRGIMKCHRVN
jgi:hypothetical protein